MRSIININNNTKDVHKVAMSKAFKSDNTYFIFRDTTNQVILKHSYVDGVVCSALLNKKELDHIAVNYPEINMRKYSVKHSLKI